MAQLFQPGMTLVARTIFVTVLLILPATAGVVVASAYAYSDWYTRRNQYVPQDIPFSHEHHVTGLGLDCRFCHTSAADSSFAGIPPTKTCMTCHTQIWWKSPMLAPVRQSWADNTPLRWTRVHDLPDYVYFDHSIHINKGVGCTTCHGDVGDMPLMEKVATLQMRWCLDCHDNPAKYLRPREKVFDPHYVPPRNQLELGHQLLIKYHVETSQLTNCSLCHR